MRVVVPITDMPEEFAGFYTLSAGSVERQTLSEGDVKRLPRYPVPVALLGRLGVDRRWSGQGLGTALLTDALRRVHQASNTLAVYAVVVDAKYEHVRAFCERFGFILLPDSATRLFLPMSTFKRLFEL